MSRMNQRQQEAVDTLDGPLLLLAGAGTGKTTVIVHRIANLVQHGIPPRAILAVTFTRKAAREMQERISAFVGPQRAGEMTISTFHAFCVKVLRRHIALLGYNPHFTIGQEGDRIGLVAEIMTQLRQIGQGYNRDLWCDRISMAKAAGLTPEDVRQMDYPHCQEVAQVFEEYQRRMKQMDRLDFDDLLYLTVKLWEEHPRIREEYHQRYQRIMIDEYQDTNRVQLKLMTMLAGPEGNLAVVGDDDQAIYGWRGAEVENILHFDRLYPNTRVIRLEQNYRSTGVILKAANAVIAHNQERHVKNLWSEKEDGPLIQEVCCEDETDEAKFLARNIREAHEHRGLPWKDFAVLYRVKHQSRILEDVFRKERIPYHLVGGTSFYQGREILDARGFLEAVANPRDDHAFLRVVNVPPRGIGDTTLDRLHTLRDERHLPMQELATREETLALLPKDAQAPLRNFMAILRQARTAFQEPGGLYEKAQKLYQDMGYLEGMAKIYKPLESALTRRDNVLEFLSSLADYDQRNGGRGTLESLLEDISLMDEAAMGGKKQEEPEAVTLMTVHAAKGLEFPVVYLSGMERDLFPHARAMEQGDEAEERRLFYVAITRAKRELFLTHAERRKEGRISKPSPPSKFLGEIPPELIHLCKPEDLFVKLDAKAAIQLLLG